jgi:DNA-binding LytR/AlgR family response regulator
MEAKLDPAIFIRIHRPTVINAEAVQHVESVYRGRVRGDNAGGNAVFFEP